MSQITNTFSLDTIEKMKTYYKENLEDPPQGAVFRARTDDAVITAYRSGKVVFQGNNISAAYAKWEKDSLTVETTKKPTTRVDDHSYAPSTTLFTSSHIGSDESGTGDYFGPITTCAVYVKEEQLAELKQMGIQDSKALTDENVLRLSKELVAMDIPYSLMVLRNERYNDLQRSGWSQGKMKAMLHHGVIEKVIKKIEGAPYEGILIDQFCSPDVYMNHIQSEGRQLFDKTYFMTKAESFSLAVAAGSIIARASFVQEMKRLSELAGVELLLGASQKVDKVAASIIQQKGVQFLHAIAKVHFANTKKAMGYLENQ